MMKFTMSSTDEYERLVKFFVENHLEFDGDEEVDTDIIKCWKVPQGEDYLVAGCVLAQREGEYIIDGIAVDKPMRKTGMGKILVEKVISEVKKRGALLRAIPTTKRLSCKELAKKRPSSHFIQREQESRQCHRYLLLVFRSGSQV